MRPDERLPTKRTASIGSRVPPAVTRTRTPQPVAARRRAAAASRDGGAAVSAGLGQPADALLAGRGRAAAAGLDDGAPRGRAGAARLAWVAGCSYMRSFIAGASDQAGRRRRAPPSAGGCRRARAASLAIVLADGRGDQEEIGVADQLEVADRRVRRAARRRGRRRAAGSASNSSVRTGAPVSAGERRRADEALGWPASGSRGRRGRRAVARRTSSSAL